MKKTFIASRISKDNLIFPPKIILEDNGLTVRIPGLFNNQEIFLNYSDISSITIDMPLIGYSTITLYSYNTTFQVHGFLQSEVKEMKRIIEDNRKHDNSFDSYWD